MTFSRVNRVQELLAMRQTRRTAVAGTAVGLAAGALGIAATSARASQLASGGLGLTFNSFAEMYGGGEIGQGGLIFTIDGMTYAVAGQRELDIVSSICWFPEGQASIPLEDAFAVIERFLPTDATRREVYTTPAAGIGPFAMTEIYKSASLADAIAGLPMVVTSGSFMIAYKIGGGLDSSVTAVNAFIGDRPTG